MAVDTLTNMTVDGTNLIREIEETDSSYLLKGIRLGEDNESSPNRILYELFKTKRLENIKKILPFKVHWVLRNGEYETKIVQ